MTTTYEPSETVPDVPLAFVSNLHLDELTNNIRSRPVPWDVSFLNQVYCSITGTLNYRHFQNNVVEYI